MRSLDSAENHSNKLGNFPVFQLGELGWSAVGLIQALAAHKTDHAARESQRLAFPYAVHHNWHARYAKWLGGSYHMFEKTLRKSYIWYNEPFKENWRYISATTQISLPWPFNIPKSLWPFPKAWPILSERFPVVADFDVAERWGAAVAASDRMCLALGVFLMMWPPKLFTNKTLKFRQPSEYFISEKKPKGIWIFQFVLERTFDFNA